MVFQIAETQDPISCFIHSPVTRTFVMQTQGHCILLFACHRTRFSFSSDHDVLSIFYAKKRNKLKSGSQKAGALLFACICDVEESTCTPISMAPTETLLGTVQLWEPELAHKYNLKTEHTKCLLPSYTTDKDCSTVCPLWPRYHCWASDRLQCRQQTYTCATLIR
jgi:hypothetical protein